MIETQPENSNGRYEYLGVGGGGNNSAWQIKNSLANEQPNEDHVSFSLGCLREGGLFRTRDHHTEGGVAKPTG